MKKQNIFHIFKSEFIKNTSILLGGSFIGQLFALIILPILSRIYSKEDFGVLAVFTSMVGILAVFATSKYEEAIPLTKEKKETYSLIGYIIKQLSLFCLFLFILVFFWGEQILFFLNKESLFDFRFLIPFSVFFTGLYYLLMDLSIKRKKFKYIASSNLANNFTASLSKIILGCFSFLKSGLIISNLIGQIATCGSYFRFRKDLFISLRTPWKDQKAAGIKYIDFPKYSMTRNLVSTFSANIPFLLLSGIFGDATLGLLLMVYTFGFRPVTFLTTSLYQTFLEKIMAHKNENKKILPFLEKYYKKVIVYTLPVCIVLFFLSPSLFAFYLGEEWRLSGIYFRYTLPWLFLMAISNPLLFIPAIFKKQRTALIIEIVSLILRLLASIICISIMNFDLAIISYSIIGSLYAITTFTWYVFLIKKYEKTLTH